MLLVQVSVIYASTYLHADHAYHEANAEIVSVCPFHRQYGIRNQQEHDCHECRNIDPVCNLSPLLEACAGQQLPRTLVKKEAHHRDMSIVLWDMVDNMIHCLTVRWDCRNVHW